MTEVSRKRILHVACEMGVRGGGAETWLLQMLRRFDRKRFQHDILVHTDQPAEYHEELRYLGCRILPCSRPLFLWKYPRVFKALLRTHGPYDAVHSHVLFAGLVIHLAQQAGVPVRIAHSHSDTAGFGVDGALLQGGFIRWTNRWVRREATLGLACSRRAAAALYGPTWTRDPRWEVLHYGLDPSPFAQEVDAHRVRADLGLPADAVVIGHAGRFQKQKNHAFLIDVAAAAIRQDPRVHFLLLGDGPLRPEIEQKVERLGLTRQVHFAGARRDVPRVMGGAMDVFALPSHYEGLPMVGLEIQVAGVPAVISDNIAEELDFVPGLVNRLSVRASAEHWATALLRAAARRRPATETRRLFERSDFTIEHCVRRLEAIYDNALVHAAAV